MPRRVLAAATLSAALVVGSPSASSSATGSEPQLVFSTNWTPWLDDHVFAWTPGGRLRSLGRGSTPAVSADGRRIAFVRDGQVWVANADGSGATQVTHEPELNGV